jgi:uncharacterized membrane protein/S-adenosylmethionine/arginine decarboxylase-like enzyme
MCVNRNTQNGDCRLWCADLSWLQLTASEGVEGKFEVQIRSVRERFIQTLCYETLGLAVVTPLYGLASGQTTADSLVLLLAVSITCMAWAAVHNTLFDLVESHLTGRVASDRPHGLRAVHALSHEVSSIIVTTPVIMLIGRFGFWHALLVDIGLTMAYTVYAYAFHMGFDALRPVQTAPVMAFAGGAVQHMRKSRGVHVMIDGHGAPRLLLEDQALLFKLLIDLPGAFGMKAVAMPKLIPTSTVSADIPRGISGYAMLNESHISFHAFPELGQVSIDFYSCNCLADPRVIADILKSSFCLADAEVHVQERGLRLPERTRAARMESGAGWAAVRI